MRSTQDVLWWAEHQRPATQREKDGYVRLTAACRRYDGDMDALVSWLREQAGVEFGHVFEQEVYHVALRAIVNP